MSDNATSIISRYLNPDSNSLRKHGAAGEKDGKNNLPPSAITTYSTYEQSIINDVQGGWNKYLEVKNNDIADKQQKLESNRQEVSGTIVAQQDQFETAKTTELESLLEKSGPNSADRASLRQTADTAQETLNGIRTLLSRPVETNYTKIYLWILIGLSFAELGINRVAITLFMGDGTMATVIALAVGVIFLFFAHTTGKILKESTCTERKPNTARSHTACAIIAVIMLVLMYFIAVIRQKVSDVQEGGQQSFEAMIGGAMTQVQDIILTPLGQEGIFMLMLNIAVFAVGVSASYFRHDPHPSYEAADKKFDRARAALERHIKLHETAGTSINQDYNKKIAFQNSLASQKEAEISRVVKELEIAEKEKVNIKEALANSLVQMLLSYYRGNESKRSTPPPAHFSTQNAKTCRELFL